MRISDWSSDVCSSGESLLDSTEFVTRLTRVAQLWHYVLIARALAFFSFAFFPGISGFLTASWQGPAMAAGIGCDLVLTVLGQVARVKRARSARQLKQVEIGRANV